jgi:hypothetical protein
MHDNLFRNYNPTFSLHTVSTLEFLVAKAVWGYNQRSFSIRLNP